MKTKYLIHNKKKFRATINKQKRKKRAKTKKKQLMRNKNKFRVMIGFCFLFLASDELRHSTFNRLAIVKLLSILFSVLHTILLHRKHDFSMPQHCTTLRRDGDEAETRVLLFYRWWDSQFTDATTMTLFVFCLLNSSAATVCSLVLKFWELEEEVPIYRIHAKSKNQVFRPEQRKLVI